MINKDINIWIIDDEESILWILKHSLQDFNITTFLSAEEALNNLENSLPNIIISDIQMQNLNGFEFLQIIQSKYQIPVIIITAYANIENAIKAYKLGSFEYIAKPFDIKDILDAINKILTNSNQIYGSKQPVKQNDNINIIGTSQSMQTLFRQVAKIAPIDITVLITGKSGSGKELIAKTIHENSKRNKKPFVALNMSAISAELIESELFGYEKGAFTGANSKREGYFEQANDGTLFLDEIGDMPSALQVKLLRVLNSGEFYRIGGNSLIKVNVRVISATHQNLEELIEKKLFREDLYYRLNVVRLNIPSLSDRKEDIPLIAEHFLMKIATSLKIPPKQLSKEATEMMTNAAWNGNVRQLENACYFLTAITTGNFIEKQDIIEYFNNNKINSRSKKVFFAEIQELIANELKNKSIQEVKECFLSLNKLLINLLYGKMGDFLAISKMLNISQSSIRNMVNYQDDN